MTRHPGEGSTPPAPPPPAGLDPQRCRIFIYGVQLKGERDHALLADSEFLGEARTLPGYTLVELNLYPALLLGGSTVIVGELYSVTKSTRFQLDVRHECPVLFQRVPISLEDGTVAESYVMRDEQVRGKRRLAQGSWRGRFAPRPRSGPPLALVQAAKQRFGRG